VALHTVIEKTEKKTVNGKIPGKSFIKEIQKKKSNSKFETNNKKV
jgi:hypothetical protein